MLIRMPLLGDATEPRNYQTLRSVRDYGLLGYQFLDTAKLFSSKLRPPLAETERAGLMEWLEQTAPERAATGPWAGIAAGYNLVAIQVESMHHFVIGYEVDGVEVTPNLNRLADRALLFGSLQDQTGRGRSSAGDFLAMTSILPVADSVAYEFPDNHYRTLAHELAARGYTTLSAIPYHRNHWNRQRTRTAFGFEVNLFEEDLEAGRKVGWGTNDRDFLAQMLPRLEALPRPFYAWLSTLSLHYPYRQFPDDLKSISLGDLEGTALGNYLHGMNLFDRAFGELYRGLEEGGLLDTTVIALWGDHSSGLLRDELFSERFGVDSATPATLLFRRVPFAVWVPGSHRSGPSIGWSAGQSDIPPTLLALFGLDPARMAYVGRNLLGSPGARPAVHPLGSWVGSRQTFHRGGCWAFDGNHEDLKPLPYRECAAGIADAQQQIEASRLLLEYDLQSQLSDEIAARAEGSERPAEAASQPSDAR